MKIKNKNSNRKKEIINQNYIKIEKYKDMK